MHIRTTRILVLIKKNFNPLKIYFETLKVSLCHRLCLTLILHENVHAIMFYQLDSEDIFTLKNGDNYKMLAELWSEHVARIRNNGVDNPVGISSMQHEIISELIDEMIPLVMNFARDRGYAIDKFDSEAISWRGLRGRTAYD